MTKALRSLRILLMLACVTSENQTFKKASIACAVSLQRRVCPEPLLRHADFTTIDYGTKCIQVFFDSKWGKFGKISVLIT